MDPFFILLQIWDGVSNKCIQTFPQAHNGAEVGCVTETCSPCVFFCFVFFVCVQFLICGH